LWKALDRSGLNEYQLLSFEPVAPSFEEVSPFEIHTSLVPGLVQRAGENATKVWWEQWGLPQLVQQTTPGYDVIHYPYFAAPLGKLPPSTGLIVTIHDMIPLALPEYAPSLQLKLYFQLVSAAARRADLILADSEYSKKDILRFLKVPPRKVQVVYLAADERYRPDPLLTEQRRELFRRYGLDGDERILFYLGGFDRRKNVITLLEAFGQALSRLKELEASDGGGRWVLALAGKPHTDNPVMYPDLIGPARRLFGEGEDAKRVRFLGPVTEQDKPLLYRTADLYAFPSLYEGFGLDPLEALASGTPILCSDASSLPEVVGSAARLVAPTDVKAWSEAIIELAAQPEKRAALSIAGPFQAARFSWQKTAERTLQLYNVVQCIKTRGVAR
jgi:glycosyltransferase involved in cell wall biosynthesis